MKKSFFYFLSFKKYAVLLLIHTATAYGQTQTFRYEQNSRASQFAQEFFGTRRMHERSPHLHMGEARIGVATSLDCGNLDVTANFSAEFQNITENIKELIPDEKNIGKYLASAALLSTCYAYPTVCAQIRHDFLSIQARLNLRSQACQAIDKFIDSQADKGAKQLRAEAQLKCVEDRLRTGEKTVSAITACQEKKETGLLLRDFQAGLEKKFTDQKQKVLQAVVHFAHAREPETYNFLVAVLGEIEVQNDGYWQPLFHAGMLRPHDVAHGFLAEGMHAVCGDLMAILSSSSTQQSDFTRTTIRTIVKRRLSAEDASNLGDLGAADRQLACAALGRAIGSAAAERAAAEGEAIIASGLLNTALPQGLRDEYRNRSSSAFFALRRTVESEQIPSIEDVRRAVADLARATREHNRILAAGLSASQLENERQRSRVISDCIDTLSCSGALQ